MDETRIHNACSVAYVLSYIVRLYYDHQTLFLYFLGRYVLRLAIQFKLGVPGNVVLRNDGGPDGRAPGVSPTIR